MPGKEEWVLVLLGSQHKCVERLVWPLFPDYPFLVTMVTLKDLQLEVCRNFTMQKVKGTCSFLFKSSLTYFN